MIPFGWHKWRGESGRRYRFKITLTKNGIPDGVSGIYVFVRRWFFFFLEPLYVGQATNFRERLLGHEKWATAFWRLGATERHICKVEDKSKRDQVEEDLIRGLKPLMNNVFIPRGKDDAPVHDIKKPWWRIL